MERLSWTRFIVFSIVLALLTHLLIINSIMAQAPNTSLAQNNNTLRIVDLKNHTISIIDPKTNQIVRVENFTGNATASEIPAPENITINERLANNSGNASTNVNLTAKFDGLQGK
jgi:DNA-binding beta-propeller fold protein YncE